MVLICPSAFFSSLANYEHVSVNPIKQTVPGVLPVCVDGKEISSLTPYFVVERTVIVGADENSIRFPGRRMIVEDDADAAVTVFPLVLSGTNTSK